MGTIRAAVLQGVEDLVIEERQAPEPGPNEVVVQVNAVGVCGSDVHYYQHGRIGDFVVREPMVLGHESAGIVVGVGSAVDQRRIGTRVSIEPGVPDLTCPECLAGRYNLCPAMRFFATPPVDGSLAELVAVHEVFAHPVPDSISDDAAALLEPLSVGVWACRKGAVGVGSRVLITGAGPVGLVALQCALAFGAAEVVVADINPHRLELAKRLGATAVVDVSVTPLDSSGVEPTVLLECSGHAGSTVAGLKTLTRAGRAVLVGMGDDGLPLPLGHIQTREIQVTGTFRYANTWPSAIALASSSRVDLDSLVTGHFTLAQTREALLAASHDPHAVKSVINPQL